MSEETDWHREYMKACESTVEWMSKCQQIEMLFAPVSGGEMKNGRMQCKDIPTPPILEYFWDHGVDGCPCGCRGDYELTEKGKERVFELWKERNEDACDEHGSLA